MKRPAFWTWTGFCGLKAVLLIGGSAALWTWVAFVAIAGVLWIEEPRWYRALAEEQS